uniref:hypothetical protein n=1 Tax=uncultured Draconibacterium sp. TaxID=1573823 RepID=UPI0032167E90
MLEDKTPFDSEKLLDEVLSTDPGYMLPDNFADVLAEKVGRSFAWEQYVKEFLIYLAVIIGIGIVSAVMALVWFDADWKEWLNFLQLNSTLVAGLNILVVFVLFADRVLLRYFMYRAAAE